MSDNYIMINGEKISISDETAANLKKQLCKEPTFKVGDIFTNLVSGYGKHVLACVDGNTMSIICIDAGSPRMGVDYCRSTKVRNKFKVTLREIADMLGDRGNFICFKELKDYAGE